MGGVMRSQPGVIVEQPPATSATAATRDPGSVAAAPAESGPHRIIVVGGGAGGLELVTRLGDRLGRRGRAQITLIDSALIHVWKPLLHEFAAGTLSIDHDALD